MRSSFILKWPIVNIGHLLPLHLKLHVHLGTPLRLWSPHFGVHLAAAPLRFCRCMRDACYGSPRAARACPFPVLNIRGMPASGTGLLLVVEHTAVAVWTKEGELFTFGDGACGQLGHGGQEIQHAPMLVEALVGKH